MFNIAVLPVTILLSVLEVHSQFLWDENGIPSSSKEFDIIDHSFKYSMAKIKDAVHQSPDRFDYVVNDLRHRNEGDDVWQLRGFKSYRGCPSAFWQFKIFQVGTTTFAAIATKSLTNNTEIYSFSLQSGCVERLAVLPTREAFDLEVITTKRAVRLVTLEKEPILHPHKRTGSQVYTISSSNSSHLNATKAEVLWSERPTCITSWVQFGVPHIAICNNVTTKSDRIPSHIYCARGGYFDKCDEILSYSPRSIKHFSFYSGHYLAVVSHAEQSRDQHVLTEILNYDLSTGSYKHFQYLPSKGAVDVCFFTMGEDVEMEHYLAVAVNRRVQGTSYQDAESSHIYKVVDGQFEPFQAIPTRNALSCLAYQSDEGRLALIFSEASGVVTYQYNGWQFVKAVEYSKHAMGEGVVNLRTASVDQTVFITVTNSNPALSGEDNVFLPEFYSLSKTGLPHWYDRAFDWCQATLSSLKKDPIGVIADVYTSSVKKNDTEIQLGHVAFQNLAAREVLTNEVRVLQTKSRLGAVQFKTMTNMMTEVMKLTDKLAVLSDYMNQVIKMTGDFVIKGPVTLNSLKSSCTDGCQVQEILSGTVNKVDVGEVYDNSIAIDDETIPATVHLSLLKVMGGVDTPFLSNKSIADYFHVDRDVVFNDLVVVDGNVSINGNLSVSGLIDGKTISPADLILKGNQTLKGQFKATKLQVDKLNAKTINGIDLEHLYARSLNKSSNLTLVNPRFNVGLEVASMQLNGRVNSINLTEMYSKSMKVTGDQIVTGTHVYNGAYLGDAALAGKFNWRDFPADFVSVGKDKMISLKKLRLTQSSDFTNLTLAQNLSGIPLVDGQPRSNIFSISKNQTQVITGTKIFHNVKSGGNVAIDSSVNGRQPVDFRLDENVFGDSKTTVSYGSLNVQAPVVFNGALLVGTLKDIDLPRLERKGVLLTSTNLPALLAPIFAADVKIDGNLEASTISKMPKDHFVQRGSDPVILHGKKKFMKNLTMKEDFNLQTTLNGFNLSAVWNNCLKPGGDQNITGVITVENDVNMLSIQSEVTQMIPLANIEFMTGSKHFTDLEIEGDWSVDTMDVKGLVNDVNVRAWSSDTILKTRNNQQIEAPKKIGSIVVGNATIYNMGSIDLNQLKDIVLVNSDSAIITSDLVITKSFIGNEMTVSGQIDHVDSELPLHWLRNTVDQTITGRIDIQGSLDLDAYKQDSWNISGIDVDSLFQEAVETDQSQSFPSLRFGHIVVNNINTTGTVQKLRISEELIRRSAGDLQTIAGIKYFEGSLTLDSFHVANLINSEEPTKLCERLPTPQSSKWVIRGDVIITADTDLTVDLLNNSTLDELTEQVWFKDSDVKFTDRQLFDSVVIEGHIVTNGTVNNVSLVDLNRRYVSTSPSVEELTAFYHFDSLHVQNGLVVNYLNTFSVNDLEIDRLQNSVLLRTQEQDIGNRIVFKEIKAKNVHLTGLVNGVDFDESVLRSDRPNVVVARKTLGSLHVDGNVELCATCLVDGVDLSQWASNAVLRHGNFTISQPVDVDTVVFESPILLQGQLDGVSVDRDHLMTLNDDQNVYGPISFASEQPHNLQNDTAGVHLHQDIVGEFNLAAQVKDLQTRGLYDGVNITRFYHKSVQRNVDLIFSKSVTVNELDAEFLKDKATNSTISDIVNAPSPDQYHFLRHKVKPVNDSELNSMLAAINQVAARQAVQLKYFEESPLQRKFPAQVGAVYAWKLSRNEDIYSCYSTPGGHGDLYCGSSATALLESIQVTSLSALSMSPDFAVTWKKSRDNHREAAILSKVGDEGKFHRHTLTTKSPLNSAAFLLKNQSCFLIAEEYSPSPIYCRSRSDGHYYTFQNLPTSNARMVSVGYFHDTGLPLLIIADSNRTVAWVMSKKFGVFESTSVFSTTSTIAIDCMCDEVQCYVVTVAPPKPVAIPGQVIIWGFSSQGQLTRLQRISIAEPLDVKLFRLPNGRLALAILQCSGIDNVMVYTLKGLSQFEHVTTIHVPGATDLQVVATEMQVLLVLTVNQLNEGGSNGVRVFRAHFLDLLL